MNDHFRGRTHRVLMDGGIPVAGSSRREEKACKLREPTHSARGIPSAKASGFKNHV